jgi:hypothetical protein
MKKLSIITAALFAAFSARCEIVIFTQAYTDTITGGGSITTAKVTGYFVFDTGTYEVREIMITGKHYHLPDTSFAQVQLLSTSVGNYSFWAFLPLGDAGGTSVKGACTLMTIGTTNKFFIPKTSRATGAIFTSFGSPQADKLEELSGSLTFDSKATVAANKAGTDIDTEFSNLKAMLDAKGYTQF